MGVKILPYDGRAPEIFEEVKRFICGVVPFRVEVERIGSTAVPGLGGKGIIDVLVVTRKELMEKVVDILVSKGFRFNPEDGTPPERLFVSGPFNFRGEELHIHIHVTFFEVESIEINFFSEIILGSILRKLRGTLSLRNGGVEWLARMALNIRSLKRNVLMKY